MGVVGAVFEVAIEAQSGRTSIKGAALNVLRGLFACALIGVLPVELYKFCVSLQNSFAGDLTRIFSGAQGSTIGEIAAFILRTVFTLGTPTEPVLKLLFFSYQKNIMGMWLVNELKRDLCPDMSFPEIVKAAENSNCNILVDANAPEFLSPRSMKAAFDTATGGNLQTIGDYFRCAYRSLAVSYREALDELEHNTGRAYEKLYIVGGGAKNQFLNRLTEDATGKQVIALPSEATALGNLKIQLEVMK